ncbi:MAG: hypothetical protein ABSH08_09680 [Tepidisphaeraceae bacterium]
MKIVDPRNHAEVRAIDTTEKTLKALAVEPLCFLPGGIYDRASVARIVRVSTRTVGKLVNDGGLPPPFYIGDLPRWTGQCLIEFFNSQQRQFVDAMQRIKGRIRSPE